MSLREHDNLLEVVGNHTFQSRVEHKECSLSAEKTTHDFASSIVLDELDPSIKEVLVLRVDEFDFSVRTKNVFSSYNCHYIGDIVCLTDNQLLCLQNFGRKCLTEVHDTLEALEIKNGVSIPGWNHGISETIREELGFTEVEQIEEVELDTLDSNSKKFLVLRIDELDLSNRATNSLRKGAFVYVGDIVFANEYQLLDLQNFGRKSLREVKETLQTMGFRIGSSTSGWDHKNAEVLREQLEPDIREFLIGWLNPRRIIPGKTLEQQLKALLGRVTSNRNLEIVFKFWGWGGDGRRTLESVGQEYGITRERVRQVVAKVERKISRLDFVCPKLNEAASYIEDRAPEFEDILGDELAAVGIAGSHFQVDGVFMAIQILNVQSPIQRIKIETQQVVISGDDKIVQNVRGFLNLLKSLSRVQGSVNFEDLLDQTGIENDATRNFLVDLIDSHSHISWLSDDKKWLWPVPIEGNKKNRIVNFTRKIFSVTPSVHISELRQGLSRHHRIAFAPPNRVLLEICRQLDFLDVKGNQVETISGDTLPSELSWLEETLIKAFQGEHILDRATLETNALALGMNRSSFYVMIGYSVVVVRLAKGVYAPIGAKIPTGAVEATKPSIIRRKRVVDSGWKASRHLWIAYQLSELMLHEGFVDVPAALKEFLQGEWPMEPTGPERVAVISINDIRVTGLQKLLERHGAEPGDTFVLIFDTKDHMFRIELGSDELVERWQNGDLDLTDDQLLELDLEDDA